MHDLYKLRSGGTPSVSFNGAPSFAVPGAFGDDPQYRFIEDEEIAAILDESGLAGRKHFRSVSGERLDAILENSAADVADAIESGEHDDILDFVMVAEQKTEQRRGVLHAVGERTEAIQVEREAEERADTLTVGDVQAVQ